MTATTIPHPAAADTVHIEGGITRDTLQDMLGMSSDEVICLLMSRRTALDYFPAIGLPVPQMPADKAVFDATHEAMAVWISDDCSRLHDGCICAFLGNGSVAWFQFH